MPRQPKPAPAAKATKPASAATKPKVPAPTSVTAATQRGVKTRKRPTVLENGPHAIDLHVGSRVRLARILAGRTQQWLAEQVSLTFQQIQKYERGANRVSCSMLSEFAEALQRRPAWFFEGTEGATETALSPELIERQRLTYELVAGFNRVPSEPVREHLVGIVRAMAEAGE